MFFSVTPDNILPVDGPYNFGLVALSCLIASVAFFAALHLMSLAKKSGDIRDKYLTIKCAVCMGGGIWSMHFIGMMAFELPMAVSYDPWLTILSMTLAIFASALAFYLINTDRAKTFRILSGGLIMGCGVAVMHYMGMASMRLGATLHYKSGLFFFPSCSLSLWRLRLCG